MTKPMQWIESDYIVTIVRQDAATGHYLGVTGSFKASNERDLQAYLKEAKKHLPKDEVLIASYNYIWNRK